jgi:peptide/nickel transport system ATP-binding protein
MDLTSPVLSTTDLRVSYATEEGDHAAVRGVDLLVPRGSCVALVGESGCGKTSLCRAVLGLEPGGARVRSRSLQVEHSAAMVLQDPVRSLNPDLRAEEQLADALLYHGAPPGTLRERVTELIHRVQLPESERVRRAYPFELSGGMAQRLAIALALASEPAFLVADEPTSNLDAGTRERILDLLAGLRATEGLSLLLVTHDLGIAARMADRVVIMYAGRVVEEGAVGEVLTGPRHHYTAGLLAAVPRIEPGRRALEPIPGLPGEQARASGCDFAGRCPAQTPECTRELPPLVPESGGQAVRCIHPVAESHLPESVQRSPTVAVQSPVVLSVSSLSVRFPVLRGWVVPKIVGQVHALSDISFDLHEGEVLGVIGETGSGKTTLIRACMGLLRDARGQVTIQGEELLSRSEYERKRIQRKMQIVYQNPGTSLDPVHTTGRSVREPLDTHRAGPRLRRYARAIHALGSVGLSVGAAGRHPAALSGGQQQRAAIARAVTEPPLVLFADEPVSALDVSIQATVLNLLRDLVQSLGISLVFVSHDLAVVNAVADTVMLLREGRVMEVADVDRFFTTPASDYGREIVGAARSTSVRAGGERG